MLRPSFEPVLSVLVIFMPLDIMITRALENAESLIISHGCSFPAGLGRLSVHGNKSRKESKDALINSCAMAENYSQGQGLPLASEPKPRLSGFPPTPPQGWLGIHLCIWLHLPGRLCAQRRGHEGLVLLGSAVITSKQGHRAQ